MWPCGLDWHGYVEVQMSVLCENVKGKWIYLLWNIVFIYNIIIFKFSYWRGIHKIKVPSERIMFTSFGSADEKIAVVAIINIITKRKISMHISGYKYSSSTRILFAASIRSTAQGLIGYLVIWQRRVLTARKKIRQKIEFWKYSHYIQIGNHFILWPLFLQTK